jgi:hypothetical protein
MPRRATREDVTGALAPPGRRHQNAPFARGAKPRRRWIARRPDLGYGARMRPFANLMRTIKTTSLAGLGGSRTYAA